jgi:hypothetical protein
MEIKNWLFNLQKNFINSKKGDQMDLKSVLIPKYHYAYQIEENDIGRACGMHGRGEKVYKVLVGKPKEETTRKTKA